MSTGLSSTTTLLQITLPLSHTFNQKLPPNHSHVLEYIFKNHIYIPPTVQYNWSSTGATEGPLLACGPFEHVYIGGKRNRFFEEARTNDGEVCSNSLQLERNLAWSGLQIEAHPELSKKLLEKDRKAWFANLGLSPYFSISEMTFEYPGVQKHFWHVGTARVQMGVDILNVQKYGHDLLYYRAILTDYVLTSQQEITMGQLYKGRSNPKLFSKSRVLRSLWQLAACPQDEPNIAQDTGMNNSKIRHHK